MLRESRGLRVALTAATGALLLSVACSDSGSGPSNGSDTGSITGSVTSDGTGVPGAGVALSGAATANRTTNASGDYGFTGLAAGSYTLTLTLPDGFVLAEGESAERTVALAAGDDATVDWAAVSEDAGVTVVVVSGTSFTPADVTIAPGETVRWLVYDGSHTVTPDDPAQPGAWAGTDLLNPTQRFEHTFTTAGTYDYHCVPHRSLGMTGTVTVQ